MTPDIPANQGEEVVLANPRGFCAGVDRAIQIVERALEVHGAPVFVLHEIVHNKHVLERLRVPRGALRQGPRGGPGGGPSRSSAPTGVSDAVVNAAASRRLEVIDATCPLVTKVHRQAIRYEDQGREVILVGHPGHPEVEGTRGRIKGKVHVLSTPEGGGRAGGHRPRAARLRHPDHALRGRHPGRDRSAAQPASPRSRGRPSRTSATPPRTARPR